MVQHYSHHLLSRLVYLFSISFPNSSKMKHLLTSLLFQNRSTFSNLLLRVRNSILIKTSIQTLIHIMIDLNEDDISYHIVRNRRSRMNWRNRCYGFDVFELLYLEELDKLQNNELILNDFLINIIMMIYQMLHYQSKLKNIPFDIYRKQSPLAAVACKLFQFLKLNITDLHQIDQEIDNLTHLFLDELPRSIIPPSNRTIEAINKDVDCYYLTRFNKEQLKLLFVHLRIPPRFTVHKTHHFKGEFILLLSLTYLASAEDMKSLVYKFGGNHDFWGGAFKEFIDHIYYTFYHKISGDSMRNYTKKNIKSLLD